MMKISEIIVYGNVQKTAKIRCISIILLTVLKISDSQQPIFVPSNDEHLVLENTLESSRCLTPGCAEAAAEILSNLDETIDPCDDFYQFTCGGWLDRHAIPEDKSYVSRISNAKDKLNLELKALLERNLTSSEPEFIKMLKSLYDSCMDLKSIEKSGSEPLKNVLKCFGGWPVVEGNEWNESKFDWIDTLKVFRQLGYDHNILLHLKVFGDMRNNLVNIIYLLPTSLGMPNKDNLIRDLDDSSTAAYFKLMVKSAKLLGANEATVENEMLKALRFEMALARISQFTEENHFFRIPYNTIEWIQNLVPQIPWLKYFNGLLNEEICENESLVTISPTFLVKFGHLVTFTEKRVVANYMLWRVVLQSWSILSQDWRDLGLEYITVLSGQKQEESRWKQCLNSIQRNLNIAFSSYYVKNFFNEDSKHAALELVSYIRREFLKMLDENDWMDEETKKQAKAKANALEQRIAYPNELLNNTAVLEIYENVTITNENYFQNIRRLKKWFTDKEFSQLRKSNIRIDWKNHAANITQMNAFYSPQENSMGFPAGILQDVFFDVDRPHYMNFGAIGHIIGHEITHGFDDRGRRFDKDGNFVNWWDVETDKLFSEKAQCVIDQYLNFTAENGMSINGWRTLGENIADIAGMKEAYLAYHSWVKDHGEEKRLPGLRFTNQQLFWISAANVWCQKERPEQMKLAIMTDVHSPPKFRINGAMSNQPEFAKDFNCSPDSAMNRKKKCQVW